MGVYARWRAGWDPDRPAIQDGDLRLDYRALHERVRRAIGLLSSTGCRPGDVVALGMPRSVAFLELHLAALAQGLVTLPLNDRYTEPEVRHLLRDSGARWAVLPDALAAAFAGQWSVLPASAVEGALRAATPTDPGSDPPEDRGALLLYTSGTTGRPKGAPSTHRNLAATVDALHAAWEWSADDVLLHALPLFHVHGLVVAQHGALRAGASAIWLDRFEPVEVLDRLAAGPATIFMGVPTFYARMVAQPGTWDLSRVRLVTSGSAGLPATVHQAFRERFGPSIVERYGMTEIGIVVSNPLRGDRRPGAIGRPLPGVEVRIVDPERGADLPDGAVGELWIRGPSVFGGYLGRPDATAAALVDGWMRTGDLGLRDPDGYLRLVGRRTELLICGGLNVYPAEIEGALLEHPAIREAAVVGLPDPDLGEIPVAALVSDPLDEDELVRFLRARLAPYKVPRRFERWDELPRNAMGKVVKNRVRDGLLAAYARTSPPEVP